MAVLFGRDDAPFDPRSYYRFSSNVSGPGLTLSSGIKQDAKGALSMNRIETYSSSENWQFYQQSGIYFIRNWDYGAAWQLGVSSTSKTSSPRLLSKSGGLGQQWRLTKFSDGRWGFENVLLGKGNWLSLQNSNALPSMETTEAGAHWDVNPNQSAGTPGQDMLVDVDSLEVASTSAAPTATSTPSAISTPLSTEASSAGQTMPSVSGISGYTGDRPRDGLSVGASAGIGIGATAVGIIILLAVWILFRKYRNKQRRTSIAEIQTNKEVSTPPDHSHREFYSEPLPVETPADEKRQTVTYRYELPT